MDTVMSSHTLLHLCEYVVEIFDTQVRNFSLGSVII